MLFDRTSVTSIRLDQASSDANSIETMAIAVVRPGVDRPVAVELSEEAKKCLGQHARNGQLLVGTGPEDFGLLQPLVAKDADSSIPATKQVESVWLAPLSFENSLPGVLVIRARVKAGEHERNERLVRELVEPFSVALANDRRLHELKVLREAADADRRLLLERLGRHQVDEDVVGANRGLRPVIERVELVAQSDIPVLILGETGTGKEVISRLIHSHSRRSGGPFVRVNCGAIPSELIDSQLFGHEKGSFTGASEQHQGWFERADGGTLFLDEIGELPLAAQVRLLRVLQDHQIERIGGKKMIHVDVRIVAATHRDLSNMVRERTFREDLWYRINVFPIYLPRLRDRLEDLPTLVRHFAQRAASRFGLPFVQPAQEDLLALADYHWPGNIRELGAVVDRAVILGKGRLLDVANSLGLTQRGQPRDDSADFPDSEMLPAGETTPSFRSSLPGPIAALDDAMRAHIMKALAACRGRVEGERGAAKLLGINPHTLRARMRKLKIAWDKFRT